MCDCGVPKGFPPNILLPMIGSKARERKTKREREREREYTYLVLKCVTPWTDDCDSKVASKG